MKRTIAWNAVKEAKQNGTLEQKPCEVCGSVKTAAHHDDYDKPLDVRWLCWHHHGKVHGPAEWKTVKRGRREKRLLIPLFQEEYETIRKAAFDAGRSVSGFLRQCALEIARKEEGK